MKILVFLSHFTLQDGPCPPHMTPGLYVVCHATVFVCSGVERQEQVVVGELLWALGAVNWFFWLASGRVFDQKGFVSTKPFRNHGCQKCTEREWGAVWSSLSASVFAYSRQETWSRTEMLFVSMVVSIVFDCVLVCVTLHCQVWHGILSLDGFVELIQGLFLATASWLKSQKVKAR